MTSITQQFQQAVINIVAKEGQPATLGTSGGTVYYNDGTIDHKDRVWVRMGADEQVLVIANAKKKGLPSIAGLEVSVVKRWGSLYIDDWEQNDAGPHTHEYATRNVVTGETAGKVGTDNVIMGDLAGENIPVGVRNTVMIGAGAGQNATDIGGDFSVIIGYRAGRNVTANANVIIGYLAADIDAIGGSSNVIIGAQAATSASSIGANNVLIGPFAGRDCAGFSNTFIGEAAGQQNTSSQTVALGNFAGNTGTRDETLYIGSGTSPLIYGEFDNENLGINSTDMAGGVGVIAIADITTAPGSTPSGGGVLYVESGALKYKGSSATITTLGVA